ncbi:MAG: hypothetical protein ABSA76_11150 [Bacteroidales bacterium]
MLYKGIKYGKPVGPLFLLALLFYNGPLYSQKNDNPLPVSFNKSFAYICESYLLNDSVRYSRYKLVPLSSSSHNLNSGFYDSLKVRASKHLVTRKLYDFVIVSGQPAPVSRNSESSEAKYKKYSGKKIGKIMIQRLSVFGSDINDPDNFNPNKLESLLNKTHLNTNEFIVRKNLLFHEGDSLSPLLLSDNERILRQLPYIDDSRIIVVPVSENEVNIVVIVKDVYSLGITTDFQSITKGSVSLFDKNILGLGHEFRLEVPYNPDLPGSPGFGISYIANNIRKSFVNLKINYLNGLGEKTYGFSLAKGLISSATKYAGGILVQEMFTSVDLDTLPIPAPLKYNLQDYWIERSFLISKESVSRIIVGARYTNNNVFNHPLILPESYHYLQQYRIYLGSVSYSFQKYYKTSLLYAYGRTEDIPYGGLLTITAGKEINEFSKRNYLGLNLSFGESIGNLGYFYASGGLASYFIGSRTEEGLFMIRTSYFSNLVYIGNYMVRNFVKADYTRGFDRYLDEYLVFNPDGAFSGFSNDSIGGTQRLSINLESVFFNPRNFYGFRFAFFAFADAGCLFGANQVLKNGELLTSVGLGIRIRNDNLLLNTFQIRLCFYPNLPLYSNVNYLTFSGEQLLKPDNFDPGAPSIIQYR